MNLQELKESAGKYLMNNYGERSLAFSDGKGSILRDYEGNEYIDFLAGISVNNLGHCHPAIVKAIKEQSEKLIHCSNLYLIEPQIKLAEILVKNSFAEKVFFANSGAEANEGAVKLARLYAKTTGNPDRYRVITFRNSFHGRTLAMISATGQEKVQKGFEPLVDGFDYAIYNDIESVKKVITPKTCAIMIEPVQGEGGIIPADNKFLEELRAICDQNNLLLIFDEIQTGLGRTGKKFAYELSGVIPDVMTLAKAIGGGIPLGAVLANEKTSSIFTPGSHGTTFGGNPVACAAAYTFCEILFNKDTLDYAEKIGEYFGRQLEKLKAKYPMIQEIRRIGLMIGLVFNRETKDICTECAKNRLLVNSTASVVLRIMPPLNVTEKNCDDAISVLDYVLSNIK